MVVNKLYDYENFQENHLICLNWVPKGSRVLEFGPATGFMTRHLRDELNCSVTGFEYSPEAAAQAASFCEQMIVGDAEDFTLWKSLHSPYDVIIFADVLEHLREPQSVLACCREFMSPDGRLLISIPNIAHWTIRLSLLKGAFDYTSCGILDNTHLKFFTKKTLFEMIHAAGFDVEEIKSRHTNYPLDVPFRRIHLMRVKRVFNWVFDKVFPNAAAFQMVVNCRPNPTFVVSHVAPLYDTISDR